MELQRNVRFFTNFDHLTVASALMPTTETQTAYSENRRINISYEKCPSYNLETPIIK